MRISPLILCIIVAFCIGTLTTILEIDETPPADSPSEKGVSTQVHYFNPFFPLIITFWVLVVIIGFSRVKIRKSPLLPSNSNWKGVLGLIIGFSLILIVIWRLVDKKKEIEPLAGREMLFRLSSLKEPLVVRAPTTLEKVLIFVGTATILMVIIIFILAFISMSKKKISPHKSIFERMGEERRKKPYAFQGSPREVVINAYGASRDHLNEKGFRYKKDKTPAEFKNDVENENLNSLTELFEEARYSNHDITNTYSKSALSYYRRLKDEY